ncbi:hypothetical protein DXG01_010000, partial [Tephrocybe rancida]
RGGKLAINILIWISCAGAIFVIAFLGLLICLTEYVYNAVELASHSSTLSPNNVLTAIQDEVFDLTNIAATHYIFLNAEALEGSVVSEASSSEDAGDESDDLGDVIFPDSEALDDQDSAASLTDNDAHSAASNAARLKARFWLEVASKQSSPASEVSVDDPGAPAIPTTTPHGEANSVLLNPPAMRLDIQDPFMAATYHGLPHLLYDASIDDGRIGYSSIPQIAPILPAADAKYPLFYSIHDNDVFLAPFVASLLNSLVLSGMLMPPDDRNLPSQATAGGLPLQLITSATVPMPSPSDSLDDGSASPLSPTCEQHPPAGPPPRPPPALGSTLDDPKSVPALLSSALAFGSAQTIPCSSPLDTTGALHDITPFPDSTLPLGATSTQHKVPVCKHSSPVD